MREPDFECDFGRLGSHIVYTLTDGTGVAYVGMSSSGLGRPFESNHPGRSLLTLSKVKLAVWCLASREEAIALEAEMIESLKPRYNRRLGGRDRPANWPKATKIS